MSLPANPDKIRFAVIDENIFGYIDPAQPHNMGVLRASVIRGAPGGIYNYPVPDNRMRPATRADFETFMVSSKGYDTDPRYEFPAN